MLGPELGAQRGGIALAVAVDMAHVEREPERRVAARRMLLLRVLRAEVDARLHGGGLSDLLFSKKPADLEAGGYYLVDPLGNLVMYFEPDIEPSAMVEDIKHLLELSRIG